MQRPLPSELTLFARALTGVAPDARADRARQWLLETSLADAFHRTRQACHPEFGDGSLIARLSRLAVPPLTHADEPDFLTSLRIVAEALLTHTHDQNEACQRGDPAGPLVGTMEWRMPSKN
jgi:hypothetical protein